MPKVVKDGDIPGNKKRYPWTTMTNGKVWSLDRGEDFDCKPQSVINAAKAWGTRHGYLVQAGIVSPDEVRVQFIKIRSRKLTK